jgi:hypothetical protein
VVVGVVVVVVVKEVGMVAGRSKCSVGAVAVAVLPVFLPAVVVTGTTRLLVVLEAARTSLLMVVSVLLLAGTMMLVVAVVSGLVLETDVEKQPVGTALTGPPLFLGLAI